MLHELLSTSPPRFALRLALGILLAPVPTLGFEEPVERVERSRALDGESIESEPFEDDPVEPTEVPTDKPESPAEPEPETPAEPIEIGQTVYGDEVNVTASRGGSADAPVTLAASEVRVEELAAPPTTLTELVQNAAGVAENGQPGLFQVVSIRGVSRQRVLTLVEGVPIEGERRAGVAVSFVDPILLESVEAVRGPASTWYGSRALGGVLQLFPRRNESTWLETGWRSFGDETWLATGWGDGATSVSIAHRRADDDEVADGVFLPTRFTQTSASLSHRFDLEGVRGRRAGDTLRLSLVPSYGSDIGKPNLQFPDRVTTYPRERHALARAALDLQSGWSAQVYAHPNDLETRVERVGRSLSVVENRAVDFGASIQGSLDGGDTGALRGVWRVGADYFARRGVDAIERSSGVGAPSVTETASLRDAEQDELAAFVSWRRNLGAWRLQAGGRFTVQRQSNDTPSSVGRAGAGDSSSDQAWSGFVGATRPLGGGFEWVTNLGTGLRFASLSERFFTGTTGRGAVVGNPALNPERSLAFDLGVRYTGRRTLLALRGFRLEVDDFIERIEIAPELLSFVNLTEGTIDGVELEGFHQFAPRWRAEWTGHWLDGQSETGQPLADISPHRLQVALAWSGETWSGRLRWRSRAAKSDVGDGELPVDSAQIVAASIRRQLRRGVALTLSGENLLDSTYRASTDDLSTAAPGRSVSLALSWRPVD